MLDLQTVIEWAVATYPGRFGIMNATLNAHSSTGLLSEPRNLHLLHYTADWISDALLRNSRSPALTAGVLLGAKFVEVYQDDADAPAFQAILAIQGDALEGNAH